MGEVDRKSLRLMRDSLLTLDTEQPEDRSQGRLDLSHVTLLEDRATEPAEARQVWLKKGYFTPRWGQYARPPAVNLPTVDSG